MASPHANQTNGVRTLNRGKARSGASFDSRRSIELVGDRTTGDALPQRDLASTIRTWMDGRQVPREVADRVEATLTVAQDYLSDMNVLAQSIVRDAFSNGGMVDQSRLAQVEAMSATVARYSAALQRVLTEADSGSDAGLARIDRAFASSARLSLPELVSAMEA